MAPLHNDWLPIKQLKGKKGQPWFLTFGTTAGNSRLAFHKGREPVESMTTGNYFEVLLPNPADQIPQMALTLEGFLNEEKQQSVQLGFLWKVVLWLVGGSVERATEWTVGGRSQMSVGGSRGHRSISYQLVKQNRHGGILTILESEQGGSESFGSSQSSLQFNWLSLTWESAQEMATALKNFKVPQE